MNEDGVTVSMHDVRGPAPTAAGFTPRGLILREAIESAQAVSAVRDVGRVLRNRTCAVGNNVPVAMPQSDSGQASVVFEYDGRLALSSGVTIRAPDEPLYQLCTNHYVQRGTPVPCTRYETIHRKLAGLRDAGKTLDLDRAWSILQAVERGPDGATPWLLTYQSVVFEPDRRRLHVALSREGKPAPRCRRVVLDVDSLLTRQGTAGGGEDEGP
jgi:hypothetical protein